MIRRQYKPVESRGHGKGGNGLTHQGEVTFWLFATRHLVPPPARPDLSRVFPVV